MKTILVADDDRSVLVLIRAALESHEYSLLEAADGPTALEISRQIHPDLLILDRSMPGMDGLHVLRALREDQRTADIPVIIETMLDQDLQYHDEAAKLGATAYLVKPFSPSRLQAAVHAALEDTPGTPIPPATSAATQDDKRAAEATGAPSPYIHWNETEALALADGEEQLLHQVVATFLDEYPARASELQWALIESDKDALRSAAHSLKGISSCIAAGSLVQGLKQLEEACHEDTLEHAGRIWSRLTGEMDMLRDELEAYLILRRLPAG